MKEAQIYLMVLLFFLFFAVQHNRCNVKDFESRISILEEQMGVVDQ